MNKPYKQGERTAESDRINAINKKHGERIAKKQEAFLKKEIAKRYKPTRSEEEMTVDIIDAIATMCQLLKGRDLSTESAQDALEDLVDNANLFQLTHALIVDGGRRQLKL